MIFKSGQKNDRLKSVYRINFEWEIRENQKCYENINDKQCMWN